MPCCVTVAIPVYNGAKTLAHTLNNVFNQTRLPDEILIVDDGSNDSSAEIARSFGARVIRHSENRGLAEARNTCLKEARGEIVVYFDADVQPRENAIQKLLDGYIHERVGAVSGQLIEMMELGSLADKWRTWFWNQTQGSKQILNAPFFIGACCSLRLDVALASRGFSKQFMMNGEDIDLSFRIRKLGYHILYEPLAQALHLRRDNISTLLPMIYRHRRDYLKACRLNHESRMELIWQALLWGPVSMKSSLFRHKKLDLATLSTICYVASLAGCIDGCMSPSKVF